MPRTENTTTPALGIRLEGGSSQYAPGDTIVGYVYRTTHAVSPDASVRISLHGRSKSKIVVSRGQSTSVYRGRFNLFKASSNTENIFQGPLHIPVRGPEQVWPFALTVPTHLDAGALDTGIPEYESYLSLNSHEVATCALPSSFNLRYHGFGANMEGFVEYFLEAELVTTSRGSMDQKTTTLPVTVMALNPGPPIADFGLRPYNYFRTVSSYRLVPGMEDAELTFSQKTKQLFGSSKVPIYAFDLKVQVPSIFQPENPGHIPFLARVVPRWGNCSEVIQDVEQKIRLTYLTMRITASTEVICAGAFSSHSRSHDEKIDLYTQMAMTDLKEPLCLPSTGETSVDVGELIKLRIGWHGSVGYEDTSKGLHPTFTIYNVRHTHQLKWEMGLLLAGSESRIQGSHRLTILPPSDDRVKGPIPGGQTHVQEASSSAAGGRTEAWMQPPPDEQPPPSFDEVQAKSSAMSGGQDKKGIEKKQ